MPVIVVGGLKSVATRRGVPAELYTDTGYIGRWIKICCCKMGSSMELYVVAGLLVSGEKSVATK
jgi:hypothetical protein